MATPPQPTMHFPAAALKSAAAMSEARQRLAGVLSGPHLELVCSVLSELFANAIDHGLLNIDSRIKDEPDGFLAFYQIREQKLQDLSDEHWISLSIDHQPERACVVMTLEHSGTGFDDSNLENELDESLTHSRGIMLVSELCDSLVYSKQGKCVTAIYRLDSEPDFPRSDQ